MKYWDADGNEYDMPSQEELADLKKKAESTNNEEFTKLQSSIREILGVDEKADLVEAIKLAKEAGNPNWPKARNKIVKLETFIKGNNKEAVIDDEGNVNVKQELTPEELLKQSEAQTRKILLSDKITARLSRYPQEKRDVVKSYFERLSTGEELNEESINRFFNEAETIVFPKQPSTTPGFGGGAPVLQTQDQKDYSSTPEGQKAANSLFGDESFAKDAKSNQQPNQK